MKNNLKLFAINRREIFYVAIAFYAVAILGSFAISFDSPPHVVVVCVFAGAIIAAAIASWLASKSEKREATTEQMIAAKDMMTLSTRAYVKFSSEISFSSAGPAVRNSSYGKGVEEEIVEDFVRYEALVACAHA